MNKRKIIKILLCAVIAAIGSVLVACSDRQHYEQLPVPQNLRVEDGALVWDEVEYAVGYAVYIDDDEHITTEARLDLSEFTQKDKVYELYVLAIGDSKHYGDSVEVRFDYTYIPPTQPDVSTRNLTYTLLDDGGGYEVSGRAASGRIVIPDYYKGLPVKKIAKEGFGYMMMYENMQYADKSKTSVILPSTIEEIGEAAFAYCIALTEVIIPDSVKVIGKNAFYKCVKLKTAELSSNLEVLSYRAFYFCIALTSMIMPDTVTRVEDFCFSYCSSLAEIRFPQNVEYFGKYAVGGTKWLQNQPNGIVAVQGYMCGYNGSVPDGSEIVIPPDVKYIVGYSFADLDGKDITLTMPDGVMLGDYAFYNFKGLTSIGLPSDLTYIPELAFESCESLESIMIPESVTEIGKRAFWDCSALISVELPSKLEKIGGDAFWGCHKLTTLRIPDSVTELDSHAISTNFSTVILSPTLAASLSSVISGPKYCIACSPEENKYDYVAIYMSSDLKYWWMKNNNPFYLYVENEQGLPDDGGNYWHYAEDGKTPVIWETNNQEQTTEDISI